MDKKKILIAITSNKGEWNIPRLTGYWMGEVTHFYNILNQEGYEIDLMSTKGGKPPLDRKSVENFPDILDPINKKWMSDSRFMEKLNHTLSPKEIKPKDYSCIYYAGGHGVMWDFPKNQDLADIAKSIYESNGIVSAVCHGVCGLLPILLSSGKPIVEGKKVTGFSNTEEGLLLLKKKVPYLTEDALKAKGALYKSTFPFAPNSVVDERLVTGQNPYSSKSVAKNVVKLLK